MNDVFDGDTARIQLLGEWFGYTLLPDVRHHKILVKLGPPRAGKGTTDRVHEGMLGSENTTGFSLYSLADKFGLRRLLADMSLLSARSRLPVRANLASWKPSTP